MYYSMGFYFRTSPEIKSEKLIKLPNKLFHMDLKTSNSLNNPVNRLCYNKDREKFGEHRNYSIGIDENKNMELIPNHRISPEWSARHALFDRNKKEDLINLDGPIKPTTGTRYIFVIMHDKNHNLQLRISTAGSHWFLANEAEAVFAAGEIYFENNKIKSINDKSGAYWVSPDHPEYNEYRKSFRRALKFFNLPIDRGIFYPFVEMQIENSISMGMAAR